MLLCYRVKIEFWSYEITILVADAGGNHTLPESSIVLNAMLRTMAALYIDASSRSLKFSYAQDKTPDGCALLCDNDAVRQEYFELRSQLKPGKTSRREPNLLRRKTTGQSHFYMLGRATKAVEMTRGGREGNNAFLNFESQTEWESGKDLVMNGMSYKDLVKVSKEPNVSSAVNLDVNFIDGMVVVAARMGSLDVASAFAEGPASSNGHERSKKLALGCFSSILQVVGKMASDLRGC
ncbi:unnamed protein product [Cylicocyclus nassatus]|uniref:Uncharacterized protein n=1 Tax=Cylicocyclus nassatus TaxID=53992 RepID=A0AA36MDJ4_CYLNA|nr:unnamed protein product [Cylicocyclus nassatus]